MIPQTDEELLIAEYKTLFPDVGMTTEQEGRAIEIILQISSEGREELQRWHMSEIGRLMQHLVVGDVPSLD